MKDQTRTVPYIKRLLEALKDQVLPEPDWGRCIQTNNYAQHIAKLAEQVSALPRQLIPQPRLYIVGGFVRDLLLGRTPHDLDLQVVGVEPQRLIEIVAGLYPGHYQLIGKSYEVIRIFPESGGEIDLSIARKHGGLTEGAFLAGDGNLSIQEALLHKDFTVNALVLDPISAELVDPLGGRSDLSQRRLKIAEPSFFTANPLQIMRGVQLVGRFGLWPSAETEVLLRRYVEENLLDQIHPRRISQEISKLLTQSISPALGLELIRVLNLDQKLFPELLQLTGDAGRWNKLLTEIDRLAMVLDKQGSIPPLVRIALHLAVIGRTISYEDLFSINKKLLYPQIIGATAAILRECLTGEFAADCRGLLGGVAGQPREHREKSHFLQLKNISANHPSETSAGFFSKYYPARPLAIELFLRVFPEQRDTAELFGQIQQQFSPSTSNLPLLDKNELAELGFQTKTQQACALEQLEKNRLQLVTKSRAIKWLKDNSSLIENLAQARTTSAGVPLKQESAEQAAAGFRIDQKLLAGRGKHVFVVKKGK